MLRRTLKVLQILSIDIAIGAVILLHFFCKVWEVSIPLITYFVLGSTVWLIYTIDHLRDAVKAPKSTRVRYRFHARHKKTLWITALILLLSILLCLFRIETSLIIGGCVLAIFVSIYLIIQQKLSELFLKEFYVSLIYTSGILLAPMALRGVFSFHIFILLLLLSFSNLMLFSWFEIDADREDEFDSIATLVGRKKLKKLILLCLASGLSLSFLSEWTPLSLYFLISFISYFFMILNAKYLIKNNLYRWIGDGVFLLPILLL